MKKIILFLLLFISTNIYCVELVEDLQDLDITRRILNEDILQTDNNTVIIANLGATVANNSTIVSGIGTSISDNTAAIAGIGTSISDNTTAIFNVGVVAANNSTSISGIITDVNNIATNTSYLEPLVLSNTVAVAGNSTQIVYNTTNINDIWAEIRYVNPSVSFTNPNRTLELGSSYSGGNISFTCNKTMVERNFTGSYVHSYGAGGSLSGLSLSTMTSDFITTITVTDSRTNSSSDTIYYSFRNRTYAGMSADEFHEISNADILTLGETKFQTRGDSGSVTPSGAEYVYVAYPADLGTCTSFTMNGLGSSAWPKMTRNVTNSSGHVELFRIYRSAQKQESGLSYDIH